MGGFMAKGFNSLVKSFFLLSVLIFPSYSNASSDIFQQRKPTTFLEEKLNLTESENSIRDVSLISKIEKNIGSEEYANFYIKLNKQNLKFDLFQKHRGKDIFLLEQSVALGRKGFSTPAGEFYIRRIVNFPIWFPPKWAKTKKIPKPGKNNPYGLWMSELFTTAKNGEYEPWLSEDSLIRIHSTDEPSSIGKYASHGCIRIHPEIADELFLALLKYTPHKKGKKTAKGIIYPLEKTIPVIIR